MRYPVLLAVLVLGGCVANPPKVYDQAPVTVDGTPGVPPKSGPAKSTGPIVTDEGNLELLERVEPDYPAATKAAGIQGTVQVKYRVNPDGSVADVSVAKSAGPSLDRHAIAAVSKWKYKPFRGNAVWLQTPIVFKIEK